MILVERNISSAEQGMIQVQGFNSFNILEMLKKLFFCAFYRCRLFQNKLSYQRIDELKVKNENNFCTLIGCKIVIYIHSTEILCRFGKLIYNFQIPNFLCSYTYSSLYIISLKFMHLPLLSNNRSINLIDDQLLIVSILKN